jgi:hypothetical protein
VVITKVAAPTVTLCCWLSYHRTSQSNNKRLIERENQVLERQKKGAKNWGNVSDDLTPGLPDFSL